MTLIFVLLVVALLLGLLYLSREKYLSISEFETVRVQWLQAWIEASCATDREIALAQYEAADRLVKSARFFARPWVLILRKVRTVATKEDYTKQKADLLARINERLEKWLDRVMPESLDIENGEVADIKFTIAKQGYGPEPDELQLFSLSVEETLTETGL